MDSRVFILLLLAICNGALAQSEEEKVISDWESIQKAYPQTTEFEKLESRKYKFKNSGFGYDGSIFIENVIIEKSEGRYGTTADVVVKMDVEKDSIYKDHDQTFGRWEQSNYLVFDGNKKSWVRFKDLSRSKPKTKEKNLWRQLLVASFPILLIVFIFWLFSRSMTKNGKHINERILDSNLLIANELKRIADHLDKDK